MAKPWITIEQRIAEDIARGRGPALEAARERLRKYGLRVIFQEARDLIAPMPSSQP